MRRTLALAISAVATLALAGVALAHLTLGGTQSATASFSAAKQRADIRTCTGPDGTYEIVRGRYEGQAASTQPALNGPIALNVAAVYNRTEQIGWITGVLHIRSADHGVQARLVGTLTQGAGDARVVDGFVSGSAGGHGANLFGNVVASFTGTGGFTGGKIGEGGANAALLAGRICTDRPAPTRLEAEGKIEVLTASAITVRAKNGLAPKTCQIRPGTSPSTANLRVGDRVEMQCGLVEGVMTLLKVKKKGRDDDGD